MSGGGLVPAITGGIATGLVNKFTGGNKQSAPAQSAPVAGQGAVYQSPQNLQAILAMLGQNQIQPQMQGGQMAGNIGRIAAPTYQPRNFSTPDQLRTQQMLQAQQMRPQVMPQQMPAAAPPNQQQQLDEAIRRLRAAGAQQPFRRSESYYADQGGN